MEVKKKFLRALLAIPVATILIIIDVFFDGWIINQIYNLWLFSLTGIMLNYAQCIGIGMFLSMLIALMRPTIIKKLEPDEDDDYIERFVMGHLGKYAAMAFTLLILQILWGFIV